VFAADELLLSPPGSAGDHATRRQTNQQQRAGAMFAVARAVGSNARVAHK
jgi:hypothetical protein